MWDSRVFGFQSLSLIELKFLWNCLVDFVILVQGVVCICQLPGKFRSVKPPSDSMEVRSRMEKHANVEKQI